MDIQSFQRKLEDLKTLAKHNKKSLAKELVGQYFAEDGLEETQLASVYEYLAAQGITLLDDMGNAEEIPVMSEVVEEEQEAAELTPEEEAYLKEYRESLYELLPAAPGEKERLFQEVSQGSKFAKKRLVEVYLEEVVDICLDHKREGLFLGDMIQEGNLAVMMAVEALEGEENPHAVICAAIEAALKQMAEEYFGRKRQDDYLVAKVERLENTVKELTEDVGEKFSIEELSAFLDMEEEEIRDVLRLTGEDS